MLLAQNATLQLQVFELFDLSFVVVPKTVSQLQSPACDFVKHFVEIFVGFLVEFLELYLEFVLCFSLLVHCVSEYL